MGNDEENRKPLSERSKANSIDHKNPQMWKQRSNHHVKQALELAEPPSSSGGQFLALSSLKKADEMPERLLSNGRFRFAFAVPGWERPARKGFAG